jgi:hypothetical protein
MFLAHLKSNAVSEVVATVTTEPVTTPAIVVRPSVPVVVVPPPPVVSAPVTPEPVTVESVETLQPLRGTGRRGDFVHANQTMGTAQGFSHVSERWLTRGKVMTFDQAIDHVHATRGNTLDLVRDFSELQPVADSGGFGLIDKRTGRRLTMSAEGLDQFAEKTRIGQTLPRRLVTGDSADVETMALIAANGIRKLNGKTCLIRTRESDNSIRAFLSEEYAVIDHAWYLETLSRIIPGGLVSHFRSDDGCDSIFFNVLIPDSLRAESDSDYGGMLACGNGETGHNRLRSLPSIFRAICQNGCIWDRVDGIGYIMQTHRGDIDLPELARVIGDNLNRQIPLLNSGIDSMLATRGIVTSAEPLPVIGAVLQTLNIAGISKDNATAILDGFNEQRTESALVTAFDVIQGITKAAQSFDAYSQEVAERAAGSAMLWTAERWQAAFSLAGSIDTKALKRIFSKSVV